MELTGALMKLAWFMMEIDEVLVEFTLCTYLNPLITWKSNLQACGSSKEWNGEVTGIRILKSDKQRLL